MTMFEALYILNNKMSVDYYKIYLFNIGSILQYKEPQLQCKQNRMIKIIISRCFENWATF